MYNNIGDIDSVQAYDVTLVIRNASNGKKYLYDIQNIKNDAVTANTLYFKSRGAANKAAQRQGIISESSIVSPALEVKGKFQLRDPYKLTGREMLMGALETAAASDTERAALQKRRKQVAQMTNLQDETDKINKEISVIDESKAPQPIRTKGRP